LYVDADGNVWVIDSGLGGDEEVQYINVETEELEPAAFGNSARIVKVSPAGEQEVIAALPSVFAGDESIGGARLVEMDGTIYATVGHWTTANGPEALPLFATVVKIEDGEPVEVADIWAHEDAENPDGTTLRDTHPYGITAGPDGNLYVADAGGNALLRVDPMSGAVETVAVFDPLPSPFPSQFRDGEMLTDPVPTNVVFGADGAAYVSLLTGFPFIPGSAGVMQVAEDGTVSEFATGLTMLVDLAMGPDGNLYVVSFGMFNEEGPVFNSGQVVRILEDGSSEVVVDGLPFPTAVAFNAAGDGYVVINGVGAPGSGAVVLYEALTETEGMMLEGG